MKLAPRKESEFVDELKEWFAASGKDHTFVHKMFSITGEPDLYFASRRKDGSLGEFRAEAKYVDSMPTSLKSIYKMMRGSQQTVIPKMAASSMVPIYLVTCVAGREALWHWFDPAQCKKAVEGKIPPWECLVLRHQSVRTPQGKWIMVDPDDPRLS